MSQTRILLGQIQAPNISKCISRNGGATIKVHMQLLMICASRDASLTFYQKVVIFVLIKCASCHKYRIDLESRACYLKRNSCSTAQAMAIYVSFLSFCENCFFIEQTVLSIFGQKISAFKINVLLYAHFSPRLQHTMIYLIHGSFCHNQLCVLKTRHFCSLF